MVYSKFLCGNTHMDFLIWDTNLKGIRLDVHFAVEIL